jgi:hypothetical protein
LRSLLRDYRDKAPSYLHDLREELSHSANGFQRLIESLAANDGEHETRLRRALGTLSELAENRAAGR